MNDMDNNAFGRELRKLRMLAYYENGNKFTQEVFGEKIGKEVGIRGFSGVTVSNWENGRSHINKDDRLILIAILKIFNQYGIIKTINDCNDFLQLGNYRRLNEKEIVNLNLSDLPQKDQKQNSSPQKIDDRINPPSSRWSYTFVQTPYYDLPSRAALLDELVEVLLDTNGKQAILIKGAGGVGKTDFAKELARRVLEQEAFERFIGVSAVDDVIMGNEVLPIREAQMSIFELWDSIALQLDREDLVGKNVYFQVRELYAQYYDSHFICLLDRMERLKDYQLISLANKIDIGKNRIIITSRFGPLHPNFRTITLTGLTVEDAIIFLEHEAAVNNKKHFLPLLRKKIDRVMNITGGLPLVLQYVLEQMDMFHLDQILDNILTGNSPFYTFFHQQSWDRLKPCCRKFLKKLAKNDHLNFSLAEIDEAKSNLGLVHNDCLVDSWTRSFIEKKESEHEKAYALNPLTHHFINFVNESSGR